MTPHAQRFLVILLLAWPSVGQAQMPSAGADFALGGAFKTEFNLDRIGRRGDRRAYWDFTNKSELALDLSLPAGFSVHGVFKLEPADREPDGSDGFLRAHAAWVDQFYLNWSRGPVTVFAGKIQPRFGFAWDRAPGLYGDDFAEGYELSERSAPASASACRICSARRRSATTACRQNCSVPTARRYLRPWARDATPFLRRRGATPRATAAPMVAPTTPPASATMSCRWRARRCPWARASSTTTSPTRPAGRAKTASRRPRPPPSAAMSRAWPGRQTCPTASPPRRWRNGCASTMPTASTGGGATWRPPAWRSPGRRSRWPIPTSGSATGATARRAPRNTPRPPPMTWKRPANGSPASPGPLAGGAFARRAGRKRPRDATRLRLPL